MTATLAMVNEKSVTFVSPRLPVRDERLLLAYRNKELPSIPEHDLYEDASFEDYSYPTSWPVRKDSLLHALETAHHYTHMNVTSYRLGGAKPIRTQMSPESDYSSSRAAFTPRDYQVDPWTGLITLFGVDYLDEKARPNCYKIPKTSDQNGRKAQLGKNSEESVRALLRQVLELLQQKALKASGIHVERSQGPTRLRISQPFHPRTISAIAPIPSHMNVCDLADRRNECFYAAFSEQPRAAASHRPVKPRIRVRPEVANLVEEALSGSRSTSGASRNVFQSPLGQDRIWPSSPIREHAVSSNPRKVHSQDRSVRRSPRAPRALPPARVASPLSIGNNQSRPQSPEPLSPPFEPPSTPPPNIPLPQIPTQTQPVLRGGTLVSPKPTLTGSSRQGLSERQDGDLDGADPVSQTLLKLIGGRRASKEKIDRHRPKSKVLKRNIGHVSLPKQGTKHNSRESVPLGDLRRLKMRSQSVNQPNSETSRIKALSWTFGEEPAYKLGRETLGSMRFNEKLGSSTTSDRGIYDQDNVTSNQPESDHIVHSHVDIESRAKTSSGAHSRGRAGNTLDNKKRHAKGRRFDGRRSEDAGRSKPFSSMKGQAGVQRRATMPFNLQSQTNTPTPASLSLGTRDEGDTKNPAESQHPTKSAERPSSASDVQVRHNHHIDTNEPLQQNSNRPHTFTPSKMPRVKQARRRRLQSPFSKHPQLPSLRRTSRRLRDRTRPHLPANLRRRNLGSQLDFELGKPLCWDARRESKGPGEIIETGMVNLRWQWL